MLFVLPFSPKTVAKLSEMYSDEISHTFLALFMKLYSRIPYNIIMDIRNQLPPNPSYDDMTTFLNTPYSQAIVITNLTNYNIRRLMENYTAQETKDLYFLLEDFDPTLDGSCSSL
jgi:2-hydroxy-3-keto-5-methylthiopentenyl-1-phosphate phosphatase